MALFALEILWVVSVHRAWCEASVDGERWERQRAEVATRIPPPTRNELVRAEQGVADQRARMERLLDACGPLGEPLAPPRTRSEAFFETAAFVEGMREEARRNGVGVREDERFGFNSYARQGPASAQLERVHRQQRAAEGLLRSLFAAGPHRFEGLQRVEPMPSGSRGRSARDETDYFAPAPVLTVALPDGAEGEVFRLTFAGHTRMLRAWLNDLASRPGPVLVRDVAVEPRQATANVPGGAAAEDSDLVRFTVVVVVVDLGRGGLMGNKSP